MTPGPAVTIATPILLVSLDVASAANTVETSSRTSMISIPSDSHPTRIGDICPPHKVKTVLILLFLKNELTVNPACILDDIMIY